MITNTALLIIFTGVIWIVYDVYLYVKSKETISDVIFGFSQHVKGIIFLVGFLCGHWFFGYPAC